MKHSVRWLLPCLLALALAGVAQASPPGRCGPPCRRGDAPRDCPPACAERGAPRDCGDRPGFAPPPRQNPELREAHHAAMKLARKAREAEGEERERLVAELREQVLVETRLIDRLQEERLDAIEKAAQERIQTMRGELQSMRENQDAFVDEQVQRLLDGPLPPPRHGPPPAMDDSEDGPAACPGKKCPGKGCGEFAPPPHGGRGPFGDRPPRHGGRHHGPRGPRPAPGEGAPEAPEAPEMPADEAPDAPPAE